MLAARPGSTTVFDGPTLNPFLALGRPAWEATRERVIAVLEAGTADLLPLGEPELPVAIGDYVDFYSSLEHATNLGRLFRPDGEPLLPNWRHLPIGYHGRAGSIVVSGTPIVRPHGQRPDVRADRASSTSSSSSASSPARASRSARRSRAAEVREHVFGFVLVNDWSARDLQRWEYQPLGPFLGKSFATSISPWIVPLAALEPYLVPARAQDPEPLPYLRTEGDWALDLELEVELNGEVISRTQRARPVLDVPAAARPRDRQRRRGAPGRPVRLGHDLRPDARQRGLADRARARRSWPTATRSSCAARPGGSSFGEVRGTIVSAALAARARATGARRSTAISPIVTYSA